MFASRRPPSLLHPLSSPSRARTRIQTSSNHPSPSHPKTTHVFVVAVVPDIARHLLSTSARSTSPPRREKFTRRGNGVDECDTTTNAGIRRATTTRSTIVSRSLDATTAFFCLLPPAESCLLLHRAVLERTLDARRSVHEDDLRPTDRSTTRLQRQRTTTRSQLDVDDTVAQTASTTTQARRRRTANAWSSTIPLSIRLRHASVDSLEEIVEQMGSKSRLVSRSEGGD